VLRIAFLTLVVGGSLLGCSSRPDPATGGALRKRATFELSCNYVELTRIDGTTAGVWGCGRRAVYLHTCNDYVCRWTIERELPATRVGYTLPPEPAVVRTVVPPPDEWRKRIPALSDDEPGF
jgi:hypothetical protein